MTERNPLVNLGRSIALVANSSWYLYNLRLGVIRALQHAGFRVVIIAPHDTYTVKLIAEGCEVIDVKINCNGLNPIEDLRFIYTLQKIYRRHRFHYVFHYTIKPVIYGSMAAALSKTRNISVISGLGYSYLHEGLLSRFVSRLYNLANNLAEEVWFVNADDQHLFEKLGIVRKEKSKLLPGEGVNPSHFKRSNGNNLHLQQKVHFLFSGRLIWTKGVGEYVQAAKVIKAKYPNAVFSVLGFTNVHNPDAVPTEIIQEWQSDGVINYLGVTDDVRPFLEKTSCFVLPSYYGEGTPRSLMEAACMEVPIITTDHVGCRDVVIDRYNGLLCEKRSVEDLVDKMEMFFQLEPHERLALGQNGRDLMLEKYDESLVIHQYLKKLNSLNGFKLRNVSATKIPAIERVKL